MDHQKEIKELLCEGGATFAETDMDKLIHLGTILLKAYAKAVESGDEKKASALRVSLLGTITSIDKRMPDKPTATVVDMAPNDPADAPEATQDFEAALKHFIDKVQADHNAYYAKELPNLSPPKIELERGQKFIRIVAQATHGSSRSAYGFIEKSTGNVYKAAGWKAPAKGARANIYNLKQIWNTKPVTYSTGWLYR